MKVETSNFMYKISIKKREKCDHLKLRVEKISIEEQPQKNQSRKVAWSNT